MLPCLIVAALLPAPLAPPTRAPPQRAPPQRGALPRMAQTPTLRRLRPGNAMEVRELSALLALPPKMDMEGSHENRALTADRSHTTIVHTIPVMAILERRPEATPIRYTSYTYTFKRAYEYTLYIGDLQPVILAYAQRGWLVKGMIPLPPGLKDGSGSGLERQRAGNEMKVILFFAVNDQRRAAGERELVHAASSIGMLPVV